MKRTIKCPKCGQELSYTQWGSINSNEKDAAKRIISGELLNVVCQNCGCSFYVDYPFLFNDMDHGYFLWYCRQDKIDEVLRSCTMVRNSQCRITTDLMRMREKTDIINAGYDDRVIELMKVFVRDEMETRTGKVPDQIFFLSNDGTPCYEVVSDDQVSHVAAIDGSYEYAKEMYADSFDAFDKYAYFVDEKWAEQFLSFFEKNE